MAKVKQGGGKGDGKRKETQGQRSVKSIDSKAGDFTGPSRAGPEPAPLYALILTHIQVELTT